MTNRLRASRVTSSLNFSSTGTSATVRPSPRPMATGLPGANSRATALRSRAARIGLPFTDTSRAPRVRPAVAAGEPSSTRLR